MLMMIVTGIRLVTLSTRSETLKDSINVSRNADDVDTELVFRIREERSAY